MQWKLVTVEVPMERWGAPENYHLHGIPAGEDLAIYCGATRSTPMPPSAQPDVTVRIATVADANVCGEICYRAFAAINAAHGFPCDFPGPEVTTGLLTGMFSNPDVFSVVAELDGRVVGSNCMDERSTIHAVGPITTDPAVQGGGVGRKLMQAVMDRAAGKAKGIRLVQAAFNSQSMSLYSRLGFAIREPLACMQGVMRERAVPGHLVRDAQTADTQACNALSMRIHGFDRAVELAQAIEGGTARVVEREGRITGYTTHLAFFGHSMAETNLDLQALIVSVECFAGPGILVPLRNYPLLRWGLDNGLRIVQPMTLMSTGFYIEPAGAWLPSVIF